MENNTVNMRTTRAAKARKARVRTATGDPSPSSFGGAVVVPAGDVLTLGVSLLLCAVAVLFSASVAFPQQAADHSLDSLRARVAALEAEAASLEEQNRGLRNMLDSLETDDLYIVVDTENNRLTLRRRDRILLKAVVGTGSRQYVEEETGRGWFFESPMGSLTVLGKERNPVWIKPDWSYVEENMPIPPIDDPDRIVRDVLGKYAFVLGKGYKIHGTKYTDLLGTHFTHGCISVGDKDLEHLYRTVPIGTKVYIY